MESETNPILYGGLFWTPNSPSLFLLQDYDGHITCVCKLHGKVLICPGILVQFFCTWKSLKAVCLDPQQRTMWMKLECILVVESLPSGNSSDSKAPLCLHPPDTWHRAWSLDLGLRCLSSWAAQSPNVEILFLDSRIENYYIYMYIYI